MTWIWGKVSSIQENAVYNMYLFAWCWLAINYLYILNCVAPIQTAGVMQYELQHCLTSLYLLGSGRVRGGSQVFKAVIKPRQNPGICRISATLTITQAFNQNTLQSFIVEPRSTDTACQTVKTCHQYHANVAGPHCHANSAAAVKSDATGKCRAAHARSPNHPSTVNTFTKEKRP